MGMTVKAWPPKGGKTVWILDKQPYQRERMSQPSDGKALCLVGALWGSRNREPAASSAVWSTLRCAAAQEDS